MNLGEAIDLLRIAGAPSRLLRHAELVAEVTLELIEVLTEIGLRINRTQTLIGAALHDAGKIAYPNELHEFGHEHEVIGERFLLDLGVSRDLARFARTHGLPPSMMPYIEDLIVAAADNLWHGVRNDRVELALVDAVARKLGTDRWSVFPRLDDRFEGIASKGDERLARQKNG